ncbi:MAG TPA: TonB family protein [Blastocatellia bacterium]|nr:TonB family protein [Blastocatellia bacterium]
MLKQPVTPLLINALLVLCLTPVGLINKVYAQPPQQATSGESARGIQLYNQGRDKEAVAALRAATKKNENDAEAWHFLGLALHHQGKPKDARKAFERAVRLRPDYVPARAGLAYMLLLENKHKDAVKEAEQALNYDPQNAEANYVVATVRLYEGAWEEVIQRTSEISKAHPEFPAAWVLKTQALVGLFAKGHQPEGKAGGTSDFRLLGEAAESLEKFLQLSPRGADPAMKFWREQLECLKMYASLADKTNPNPLITSYREATMKPVILHKERASYTEEARQNKVQGTVVLMMIVDENGRVRSPIALKPLPHGLTESCVRAAYAMRFKPAEKDGKPVAVILSAVEFSFEIF